MKGEIKLPDGAFEEEYSARGYNVIAGTDEAGRGPLAGRVYAAACVLPHGLMIPGLNDSKKLTERAREKLFGVITGAALSYGIAYATVEEIDTLNILNAAQLAMRRAVEMLDPPPDLVLVDGNIARDFPVPAVAIVGGDSSCVSIAAASVLAKVARDRYCAELDALYPGYGFALHKGYPTKAHYMAIEQLGAIDGVHRMSFKLYR
jgi:ribonuclease HII